MAQADTLIQLVQDLGIELIHDRASIPYALVPLYNETRGVYLLRSGSFWGLIAKEFYRHHGKVPNSQAVASASSS